MAEAAQPLSFIVRELGDDDARTSSNLAYVSSVNIGLFRCKNLRSSNFFRMKILSHNDNNLQTSEIALNSAIGEFLNVVTGGEVFLNTFSPTEIVKLGMVCLEGKTATQDMDASNFKNVLVNQDLIPKYHTKTIRVTSHISMWMDRGVQKEGGLSKSTKVFIQSAVDSKFKNLGVGGLGAPVTELLKAAFPSRNLSKDILQRISLDKLRLGKATFSNSVTGAPNPPNT